MDDLSRESARRVLAEARSGDFDAFRRIVLQYSNAMLSVAYGVIGDFHEAQDATQEAFVKAYRQLHTLSDPDKLGSWLYAIVYRTSLDFVKKRKPAVPYSDAATQAVDNVDAWLDRRMTQEAVWEALQDLERKSRTALVLHCVGDWPMKEIGRFLELSVSAVESRIRRARETLKRKLAVDFEPYFRKHRLDRNFERRVSERVLRSMGHFYIPVVHRERTSAWFVRHFSLGTSPHGNLLLASGHELYLLECPSVRPGDRPLMAFEVPDLDALWQKLRHAGVETEPIATTEWLGDYFAFRDPDGNRYHAVKQQ